MRMDGRQERKPLGAADMRLRHFLACMHWQLVVWLHQSGWGEVCCLHVLRRQQPRGSRAGMQDVLVRVCRCGLVPRSQAAVLLHAKLACQVMRDLALLPHRMRLLLHHVQLAARCMGAASPPPGVTLVCLHLQRPLLLIPQGSLARLNAGLRRVHSPGRRRSGRAWPHHRLLCRVPGLRRRATRVRPGFCAWPRPARHAATRAGWRNVGHGCPCARLRPTSLLLGMVLRASAAGPGQVAPAPSLAWLM